LQVCPESISGQTRPGTRSRAFLDEEFLHYLAIRRRRTLERPLFRNVDLQVIETQQLQRGGVQIRSIHRFAYDFRPISSVCPYV